MDLPVLTRVALDGEHQVRFPAAVLAAATTQRPGAGRWTELTVYRVQIAAEEPPAGLYVVAKVGRSVVAHLRRCNVVDTRRMTAYTGAPGQDRPRLMPCRDCLPVLDPPDPTVVLERDRHQMLRARTARDLGDIIFPRRDGRALTGMTADAVDQLRTADPDFDHWWTGTVVPHLVKE